VFVDKASRILAESKTLFALRGTMQPQAFNEFRKFTEGASAIQSKNDKLVEALCREPDPDRLQSTTCESVPEVKQLVVSGHLALEQALRNTRERFTVEPRLERELIATLGALSGELQRSRKIHYRLALRMLGTKTGTGYTEGTPYLARVRTIPVFTL
jgi:tryptophan 2,3-dioxygenase